MLDLEPRVHLEEEQIALVVGDELARAGAHVRDLLHDAERGGVETLAPCLALGSGEERGRRRRLLEDLLVPALEAALALAEGKGLTVRIAEDLHLDVPRLRDVPLQVDACVGEARLAAVGARLQRALDPGLVLHDLHPDPAPATDRLHDDRVADLRRDRLRVKDPLGGVDRDRLVGPGHRARSGGERHVTRLHLVAEGIEHIGGRTDEHDPCLRDRTRERGLLAEEPVARVDRRSARLPDRLEDRVRVKIRVLRRGGPDQHGLVCIGDVRGVRVGLRVDRDGLDPEALARADDPARDLAAVAYEDLFEGHDDPLTILATREAFSQRGSSRVRGPHLPR